MKQQILARALLAAALFSLAGCDSVKSALGLDRHVPDETKVVARPALTLPPDYNLRPPGSATPVSGEHETGVSLGQVTGTTGEQALENGAAAGAPKRQEKGFFGRVFDAINPFSDDSEAEAAPQAAPPESQQTPTQPTSGTPAPGGQ